MLMMIMMMILMIFDDDDDDDDDDDVDDNDVNDDHLCSLPHCFQQDFALEVATLGPECICVFVYLCICIFEHLVDRGESLQPMNRGTSISHLCAIINQSPMCSNKKSVTCVQ